MTENGGNVRPGKGFYFVSARSPQYEGKTYQVQHEKSTIRRDLSLGALHLAKLADLDASLSRTKWRHGEGAGFHAGRPLVDVRQREEAAKTPAGPVGTVEEVHLYRERA